MGWNDTSCPFDDIDDMTEGQLAEALAGMIENEPDNDE